MIYLIPNRHNTHLSSSSRLASSLELEFDQRSRWGLRFCRDIGRCDLAFVLTLPLGPFQTRFVSGKFIWILRAEQDKVTRRIEGHAHHEFVLILSVSLCEGDGGHAFGSLLLVGLFVHLNGSIYPTAQSGKRF